MTGKHTFHHSTVPQPIKKVLNVKNEFFNLSVVAHACNYSSRKLRQEDCKSEPMPGQFSILAGPCLKRAGIQLVTEALSSISSSPQKKKGNGSSWGIMSDIFFSDGSEQCVPDGLHGVTVFSSYYIYLHVLILLTQMIC